MLPEMIGITIAIVVIILSFIVTYFITRDSDDNLIKIIKRMTWKQWKFLLASWFIATVYLEGANICWLIFSYKGNPKPVLWNPRVFGGMPAFATGVGGYSPWNFVKISMSATLGYMFDNPIMFIIFLISLIWLGRRYIQGKPVVLAYWFVICIELFMLLTQPWPVLV